MDTLDGTDMSKSSLKRQDSPPKGGSEPSGRSAVWILIDKSGSMSGMEVPVVKGVSDLIDEQAALPGKCKLTVAQFDSEDPYDILLDCVPIKKADKGALDRYKPGSTTPLYDAIGSIISAADKRAKSRSKSAKEPEDQVVVIVTDGYENASTEYTAKKVRKLIEKRRESGWAFVFLGANQDSYAEGGSLGVSVGNTQNYAQSAAGYATAFSSTSRSLSTRRETMMMAGPEAVNNDEFFDGVKEAEEELADSVS